MWITEKGGTLSHPATPVSSPLRTHPVTNHGTSVFKVLEYLVNFYLQFDTPRLYLCDRSLLLHVDIDGDEDEDACEYPDNGSHT